MPGKNWSLFKEAHTSFSRNMRIGPGQNAYLKVSADFESHFDGYNNKHDDFWGETDEICLF